MKLETFDYELPKELIAQEPLDARSTSKLMVVKGDKPEDIEHKTFNNIIDYLKPGDVLVLNETKVEPCKLIGKKETGAKAQFILSKKIKPLTYEAQITTNKPKPGNTFIFPKQLEATIIEQKDMTFIVEFNKSPDPHLDEIGEMPLPPYIKTKQTPETKDKYQTVYAKNSGSIAAPTAGFHFTPELLRDIEKKGIKIVKVTLHVGYGTFLPVKTEDIKSHHMHEEEYEITQFAADAINNRTGRLIFVGTTSLRAIESASDDLGIIQPKKDSTDIFIYPPYDFKCRPELLITNFHLPKSTLLMLVSAFTSIETIKNAYQEAIKHNYRFFSFGDAMLLSRL